MSARTSPEALATLAGGLFRSRRARTGNAVRRSSYHVGEREGHQWRASNMFSAGEHNARMRAAEQFDRDGKEPGKRNGALGHIALEILRFMLRLRNRKTGRLDPSLTWLAGQLRRSRSAVAAALARLKTNGFIDWIRRTRPVDDPLPDGPRIEQASNAYFFQLPRKAAEKVRQMLRRPTEAMRRRAEDIVREAHATSQSPEALADGIHDPDLSAAFKHLLAEMDRGSAEPSL